jgi:hypothetical protein
MVGKYGGKIWWENMVGKYGGKIWWENMVGKYGGKIEGGILVFTKTKT